MDAVYILTWLEKQCHNKGSVVYMYVFSSEH